MIGETNDAVIEYAAGPRINTMDEALLEATSDSDFPATGNSIDMAVTMKAINGTAMGFYDNTINYDANTTDKVAIPGTDYEWNSPAANKVEFKALTANNYKVRVI